MKSIHLKKARLRKDFKKTRKVFTKLLIIVKEGWKVDQVQWSWALLKKQMFMKNQWKENLFTHNKNKWKTWWNHHFGNLKKKKHLKGQIIPAQKEIKETNLLPSVISKLITDLSNLTNHQHHLKYPNQNQRRANYLMWMSE